MQNALAEEGGEVQLSWNREKTYSTKGRDAGARLPVQRKEGGSEANRASTLEKIKKEAITTRRGRGRRI